MRDYIQVDFKYKGQIASLKLYSKYTSISGDSGDKKSKFINKALEYVNRDDPDFSYTVSNGFDITFVNVSTPLKDFISLTNRVFVLDDYALRNSRIADALLNTDNLFILVCRSTSMLGCVPLIGCYTLQKCANWYSFSAVQLPMYNEGVHIDKIITESDKDRSEHALLSVYKDDIIPSKGQGNVLKQLYHVKGIKLVLLDLGNVGDILPALQDYVSKNNDVYFYDYQAFEELLYKSPLLQHLICDTSYSVFTTKSLEEYYENVLEECTRGTEYEYVHKHPVLAAPYLDKANFNKIFDSEVGRALIPLLSPINSSSFNSVEYLQNKAGDKFKYFTQLQIDNCTTQEDCDELLQSLRWLD